MEKLIIEPSEMLPGILLDRESGKFKFYGKSCPVDPLKFYSPVFNWFEDYIKYPLKETVVEFYMTYYNTASAKIILKILNKIEHLSDLGNEIIVKWFYNENDEDMLEAGEQFQNIIDVKFEFIAIESNNINSDEESEFDDLMNDIL